MWWGQTHERKVGAVKGGFVGVAGFVVRCEVPGRQLLAQIEYLCECVVSPLTAQPSSKSSGLANSGVTSDGPVGLNPGNDLPRLSWGI